MASASLRTLYSLNKRDKLMIWSVSFDGERLHKSWGQEGGKMAHRSGKVVVPKQKRTLDEQVQLEINKLVMDKKRAGYTENRDEIEAKFHLMKPEKWTEGSILFPAITMPKLDGFRAVYRDGVLRSRVGIEISFLETIKEEARILASILGCMLDGELYNETLSFQDIESIVGRTKDPHELEDSIQYHIFDIYLPDKTHLERLQRLEEVNWDQFSTLYRVPYTFVGSEDELREQFDRYIEDGNEGAILRRMEGPYKRDKTYYEHRSRSHSKTTLKMKPLHDTEGKVIDVTPDIEGAAILLLELDCGSKFKLRVGGALEDRQQMLRDKHKFIGLYYKFSYTHLTESGIPKCCSPIGYRSDVI